MKNSKKAIVCRLALLMMLSLAACGSYGKPGMLEPEENTLEKNTMGESTPKKSTSGERIPEGSTPKENGSGESIMEESTLKESTSGESILEGSTPKENGSGESNPEGTETADTGTQSKQNEQGSSEGKTGQSQDYKEDKYKDILLGNEDFISTDLGNQSLNIKKIGQAVTDDDSVTVSVAKFASIDLDGDGEMEIVLWLRINDISDYGFEVLHYQDGAIYGYTIQYREFMNLKTDGTFSFSGGAADFGTGRLTLSDVGYNIDEQIYSQSEYDSHNELTVQYFADGVPCSEEEFNNAMSTQEQKADVEWYDLKRE